jgi:succinate dehydrogenase / fumarate reductase iron-sulfur subunit
MSKHMKIHLKVWRQENKDAKGHFEDFTLEDVSPDMSFLEMLDILNEKLIMEGKAAVEFDSDCREGICGTCGLVINGTAHGPDRGATVCQLHMRHFKDGDKIVIEPWRAVAFPVVKDLVVDRSAFDRVVAKGGYTSVRTGGVPEASTFLATKDDAENAMDYAQCIGCGACVAACPNASASLFVGAKVSQYTFLPQGKVEASRRVERMVLQMDEEGFGACSNHGECEAVCPKEISITAIARLRREFTRSAIKKQA